LQILSYKDICQIIASDKVLAQLNEIFFVTSGRTSFESEHAKLKFRYFYLDYFLEHYPDFCFCALDESRNVVGYIVASADTLKDQSLFEYHQYLELFREHIHQFPAQLHINLLPVTQGRGIGGLLIQALEHKLRQEQVPGVFLITGQNSRNVSFYNKHKYDQHWIQQFKSNYLIFMGKNLH